MAVRALSCLLRRENGWFNFWWIGMVSRAGWLQISQDKSIHLQPPAPVACRPLILQWYSWGSMRLDRWVGFCFTVIFCFETWRTCTPLSASLLYETNYTQSVVCSGYKRVNNLYGTLLVGKDLGISCDWRRRRWMTVSQHVRPTVREGMNACQAKI